MRPNETNWAGPANRASRRERAAGKLHPKTTSSSVTVTKVAIARSRSVIGAIVTAVHPAAIHPFYHFASA